MLIKLYREGLSKLVKQNHRKKEVMLPRPLNKLSLPKSNQLLRSQNPKRNK